MTTLPSQIDLSNLAGLRTTMARARRHVVPPPDLLPSEWVEQHVRIPRLICCRLSGSSSTFASHRVTLCQGLCAFAMRLISASPWIKSSTLIRIP